MINFLHRSSGQLKAGPRLQYPRLLAGAVGAILLGMALVPLFSPAPAMAAEGQQGAVLQGTVVDPAGLPVAGITVSLHRVSDSGGNEIGRAVSDRDGRFVIEAEVGGEGGVYFAATRFDGVLYMGEAFRSLYEAPAEYRIVIGAGGIAGGPARPAPPPPADRSWLAVVVLLAAVGAGVVLVPIFRTRRGPLEIRTVLMELAELEEAHASLAGSEQAAAAKSYLSAREALYSRLRQLTGRAAHATDLD